MDVSLALGSCNVHCCAQTRTHSLQIAAFGLVMAVQSCTEAGGSGSLPAQEGVLVVPC